MPATTLNLGMDVTDVKAGVDKFIDAMNGAADSTFKLFETMAKANKEGEVTRKTLVGIAEDGTKMVATLKKVGDAWELVNVKATASAKAVTAAIKAQTGATVAAQLAAQAAAGAGTATPGFGGLGPVPQPGAAGGGLGPPPVPPVAAGGGGYPNLPNFLTVGQINAQVNALAASTAKANTAFKTMEQVLRQIEGILIRQIFIGFQTALIDSVGAAQQFSLAIAEIQTISQKAALSTQEWQVGLTDLANQFGNTQADVAEAAYQSLSNQVTKGRDTFEFLGTAQKFAAATQSTVTDSVNLLSSAIRSFKIPVAEAERVASIFFKTIELGRVRAKDMADTFGRVAAPASELGVTLEEVSAGIATLTDRGIKFADASTLISNILFKMNRPTDAMKELFREWGVTSGQAAFATFGFSGVLSKLNEEAAKGPERLGELFNQIRGLRGAFNFSGQGLQDFQENLAKIGEGGPDYANAVKMVMESPGKQLQIEIQKIKSYFTNEFGMEMVKAILKVRDALKSIGIDGFVGAIQTLITTVKAAVIAFIAYSAAMALQAIVTPIVTTLMAGQAATTIALSTAYKMLIIDLRALGAVLAANPFATAFIATFALHQLLQDTTKSVAEVTDEFEKLSRVKIGQKYLTDSQTQRRIEFEATEDAREQYDIRFKVVLGFAQRVNQLMAGLKARAIDNLRSTTDALKISSKTLFDTLSGNVTELGRKVTEARELIKQSLKVTEDIPRQAANRSYETKLKYASEGNVDPFSGIVVGEQKIELIRKKLLSTMDEARKKAAEGTKESFEESRKLFGDAEKLQSQLFDQQTTLARRNFEEAAKRGLVQPTGIDPTTGQQRFEFTVRTVEYEKQSNKLAQERLALEARFRAEQKQRQRDLEDEIAKEKERLRSLQQAFGQLEKLSALDAAGKIKKEFAGPGGTERALAQFDELAAKIKELAGPGDFGTQFAVFSDLLKQRQALVQVVNAAQREEEAKTATQGVIRAKEATTQIIDQATAVAKAKTQALGDILAGVDKQLKVFGESDVLSKMDIGFIGGTSQREVKERLAAVKEARDAFAKDQTAEKATAIKEAIEALNKAITDYAVAASRTTPAKIVIGPEGETLAERQAALTKLGAGVVETAAERDAMVKKLTDAKKQAVELNEALLKIPDLFGIAGDMAVQKGPEIISTFDGVNIEVTKVVNQLTELNRQLAIAAAALPAIRGGGIGIPEGAIVGPPTGNMGGYLAAGGYAPRGSDRYPAMIGGDEMVMRGWASSNFAPLLRSLNAGAVSPGGGKGTTTNVGDININMSASGSQQQDIRKLGVELRRAIKRGLISLD